MILEISVKEKQKNIYMIELGGYLDSSTYIELKDRIASILVASTKGIIFDLENLIYISSAGMGVIFQARRFMDESKGAFIMTNLQPQIEKAFQIMEAWPGDVVIKSRKEIDNYLDFMQRKEIKKRSM